MFISPEKNRNKFNLLLLRIFCVLYFAPSRQKNKDPVPYTYSNKMNYRLKK